MGAELRKYDEYPEEDLDFIRELEEEEEEILSGAKNFGRFRKNRTEELRRSDLLTEDQKNGGCGSKTGEAGILG